MGNNPPDLKVYTTKADGNTKQSLYRATSSGGGDGGDIMYRIGRLEEDVKEIKSVLNRLEPYLIRIDEKLKHIPTTIQLVIMIITIFSIAIGIANLPNIINAVKGKSEISVTSPGNK